MSSPASKLAPIKASEPSMGGSALAFYHEYVEGVVQGLVAYYGSAVAK